MFVIIDLTWLKLTKIKEQFKNKLMLRSDNYENFPSRNLTETCNLAYNLYTVQK